MNKKTEMLRKNSKGTGPVNKKIKYNALADLTQEQKEIVLKLMARTSEASFRRGYQQGQECEDTVISGFDLRYGRHSLTLDFSKEPVMGCRTVPSTERLLAEYGNQLKFVGLSVENKVEA